MGRLGLRPNERHLILYWRGGAGTMPGPRLHPQDPTSLHPRTYKEETEALSATEIKDQRGRGLSMD